MMLRTVVKYKVRVTNVSEKVIKQIHYTGYIKKTETLFTNSIDYTIRL